MIEKLRNLLAGEKRAPDAEVWHSPALLQILPNPRSVKTGIDVYKANPYVYAAVRTISREIARSKLRLYREQNGELIEESGHPAMKLLERPNEYLSGYEMLERIAIWLETVGKAVVYWNIPEGLGVPVEAFVLDPRYLVTVPDPKTYVKAYVYKLPNQPEVRFTPDEITVFYEYDLGNDYGGHSPAQSARYAIESDIYGEQWNRDFFLNDATPATLVNVQGKMNDDAYERFKQQWNSMFRGRGKNSKVAILEGGVDVKKIQTTQKEMDFIQLGENNRDRICAAFGVPKQLLGLDATGGNLAKSGAEAMIYFFQRFTIMPKLRAIEVKLNMDLLTLFRNKTGGKVFFKFDDPKQVDAQTKLERYRTLFSLGAITPNEIRFDEGLEAVDGGDVPLVPAGLIPLTDAGDLFSNTAPVDGTTKELRAVKKKT